MTIGGLALGGLGALIFVILINYVIQPQMSVETRGIYEVRGDRFNVWYHDDSPNRVTYDELNGRLEASLDDLLVRLDVDPVGLPLPIDVLVHDNVGQLQTGIAQRKAPGGTHTFYAVIDLLAGEDPYPRLAELVLAFGWGECYSQLLYNATLAILVEPDRGYDAAVAAAPERLRHSVDALVRLDAAGEFEPTIYQRFDSPFSSSMALSSLEGIAAFYTVFGGDDALPEEDFAALQAASLVEYLVECSGGFDAIREVWGPGSSSALLRRLACGPFDEMTAAWWESAIDQGTPSAEYAYYRALYLFEAGDFEEAHRLVSAWSAADLSAAGLTLAVRASLAVGAFDEAAAWLEAVETGIGQLTDWVALYEGWSRFERDGITVLGDLSETDANALAEEVRAASRAVSDSLALPPEQIPARMTVFCYETDAARQVGEGVTPDESSRCTAWHVVEGEDIAWALASSLPAYAYGIATASNLLRTGIAAIISVPRSELRAVGCEILLDGEWTPLWQLGFGGVTPNLFRTQSGLMMDYVIDTYGLDVVSDLWYATARLGGGRSLDSAMLETIGTTRREIEGELLNAVLVCD
jgi:hypothetical protein